MATRSEMIGLFAGPETGTRLHLSHPSLGETLYRLTGAIELPLAREKRAAKATKKQAPRRAFVTLLAEAQNPGHEGFPNALRIVSADKGSARIAYDKKWSLGSARLPVEIVYDDLDVTEGFYPVEEPAEPMRIATELHVTFALVAGDWRLGGSIPPVPLPGEPPERVPVEIFGGIEIGDAPVCNEICVRLWSKTGNVNEAKADQILEKVNAIWGCSGGQCCIRAVKARYSVQTTMSSKPLIRNGVLRDHLDIVGTVVRDTGHRSKKCFDIYFVDRIRTTTDPANSGPLGATSRARGRDFSLIATENAAGNGYSTDALGFSAAHEIGHVLGLARRPGTDAQGVKTHSSSNTNLMQPSVDPDQTAAQFRRRSKLNKHQCEAARKSKYMKPVKETCTAAPREGEPV